MLHEPLHAGFGASVLSAAVTVARSVQAVPWSEKSPNTVRAGNVGLPDLVHRWPAWNSAVIVITMKA
jgi:hypothetical protein